MNNFKKLIFLTAIVFSNSLFSMSQEGVNILGDRISKLSVSEISCDYYSDSEDAVKYEYIEDSPQIPESFNGTTCLLLTRGIHFTPHLFNRKEISFMRKHNFIGEPIYSLAAYDLSKENFLDIELEEFLQKNALRVRNAITSLSVKERDYFQEVYSNKYDSFHDQLNKPKKNFYNISKHFCSSKNPQVSTSESLWHSGKYAFGLKGLGNELEKLDPEYDEEGKPKHPYLGKIYVILVDINDLDELDPYFVLYGYAHNFIWISTHFTNDILSEREVAFPGFIPGKYVVYSQNMRMPSFKGDYKPYYKEKYGITRHSYKIRKTKLKKGDKAAIKQTIKSLKENIIKHNEKVLMRKLKQECEYRGIEIVYKDLEEYLAFCYQMSPIEKAKEMHDN